MVVDSADILVLNQIMEQLSLLASSRRGGKRKGAGRKAVVPGRQRHELRGDHQRHHPVHVVLRVVKDVPRLRNGKLHAVLRGAFAAASGETFRLVHYSVQGNHLHLIVEAEDKLALARGMQGLAIRIARGINGRVGRKGKVFFDRYFPRAMTAPQQVRRGLVYVLNNYLHHERDLKRIQGPVDPYSSAAHFDGWLHSLSPYAARHAGERICPPARTWLLTTGWQRHGKLLFKEGPA